MDDQFKIYVEQLRDGHIENIAEEFPPAIMDMNDKELAFHDKIVLRGQVYLAEETLVLHFNVTTSAILLCSVCNAPVKVPVEINGSYQTIPLEEIKGGVFNFKEILREAILLETPTFAECEGDCPRRKEIAKYLKKTEKTGPDGNDDEGYHPFADIKWDKNK
jgi:uncharacterized metal-binding protein YceD (DUF177 family)